MNPHSLMLSPQCEKVVLPFFRSTSNLVPALGDFVLHYIESRQSVWVMVSENTSLSIPRCGKLPNSWHFREYCCIFENRKETLEWPKSGRNGSRPFIYMPNIHSKPSLRFPGFRGHPQWNRPASCNISSTSQARLQFLSRRPPSCVFFVLHPMQMHTKSCCIY